MQIKIEGSGQMAQMMAQRANMTMTVKVIAISTDPIPDDVFVVPAGYTKQQPQDWGRRSAAPPGGGRIDCDSRHSREAAP